MDHGGLVVFPWISDVAGCPSGGIILVSSPVLAWRADSFGSLFVAADFDPLLGHAAALSHGGRVGALRMALLGFVPNMTESFFPLLPLPLPRSMLGCAFSSLINPSDAIKWIDSPPEA
jgi:hypothetical protein